MDVNLFAQLISNVGFPIAVCVYLAYSNEKLRECVNENTKTIESLKQMIYDLHRKD
jgi:hypothetical protein